MTPEAFAVRVLEHDRFELLHELAGGSERELRVDPGLERVQPHFL